MNVENLYSIDEFCAIFKISRPTFYNWSKDGKIKTVIVCKRKKITESEINRLLLLKGE